MDDRSPENESTPTPPERYVDEIMRLAAEKEKARRAEPERRRSRLPLLIGSLIVLVLLSAWNLVRLLREPIPFTAAEEDAASMFTIYLVAQGIEAYRDSAGEWPENLAVLGLEDDGVGYVRHPDGYTLTAEVGTARVTYSAGEDLAPFAAAYDSLTEVAER